jgi:integrase
MCIKNKWRNSFRLLSKSSTGAEKKSADAAQIAKVSPSVKTLAKATIDTVIKQLRKFFNHARKRKIIAENPASGLSQLYSQARTAHEVIEPLTREEVPLFLGTVKKHDDAFVTVTRPDGTKAKRKVTQHYPLFFMAIHTGLRAGELAGLQRGDIDFHGKYIVVQRSIDRAHRKVVPTKSKRIRRVDLSDDLRQQKEWWFAEGKPQPECFRIPKANGPTCAILQIVTSTSVLKRADCIIGAFMTFGIPSLP